MNRIFFVLTVAFIVFTAMGCATNEFYQKQMALQGSQMQELQSRIGELEAQSQMKDQLIDDLYNSRMPAASSGTAPATMISKGVNQAKVDALKKKGYEVELKEGLITVELSGSVLFDPGKDELTKAGKAELDKAVKLIKNEFPEAVVRIEGHTDSSPIVKSKKEFASNWELSAARAIAVLEYMKKQGLKEKNMYVAGFADTKPVADNKDKSGKKSNRRVELVIFEK
ncbi:MAG: OmpA family protein [Planctomycetes bacterium]|nr:OmpA family protein [Planctomycetota bacterium]